MVKEVGGGWGDVEVEEHEDSSESEEDEEGARAEGVVSLAGLLSSSHRFFKFIFGCWILREGAISNESPEYEVC
jgi:hypothetical protein